MTEQLSRRTALACIGTAGALASAPVVAAAAARPVERSAWDRAFAAFEQATAEEEAFDPVYAAICDRYEAALAAIPHATLRPDPYSGRRAPVTTSDTQFVREARRTVEQVKAGKCYLETDRYPDLAEHYQLQRDAVAADERRQRKIRQLRASIGMDEAEERYETLGQRAYEAKWALMRLPAPDGQALLWKLNVLLEGDAVTWSEDAMAQPIADARRLLAGQA